ncbi:hypothetical protein TNCT_675881 [Trichonephila clavata]|uniref:Uncharacterized protein n=1 Tax=Trichonephila clavata TaxID=2740835 RepID=A0A8X6K644_TRICU|nr:hypothetical protein TNCT_675881 [Trichonephila clavata]
MESNPKTLVARQSDPLSHNPTRLKCPIQKCCNINPDSEVERHPVGTENTGWKLCNSKVFQQIKINVAHNCLLHEEK